MRSSAASLLRRTSFFLLVSLAPVVARAQPVSPPALLSQPGPTFTVPDSALSKNLTFIVYGDTRFTDPANTKAADPPARRALVAKIAEEHPDALIITGDLPYRGTYAADYAEYEKETTAWRDEHLRLYPALGNHELGGHGPDNWLDDWWKTFPELKDRRWYSVAFGSRIYLLCLDSNSALTPGSEQRQWLEEQIAHLPRRVEFVVLVLHHPPVADIQTLIEVDHNPRPNEISLRDYLSQIAPHSHAQFIVAAGHIHNYERATVDGVTYLVSGGGGAHPYPVVRTPQDQYQATDFPNFHYILFRLEEKQLHATMFRLGFPVSDPPQWQDRDSFTITAK
ncbi:MAG: metallophosphoesterase [Acidobacteriaceae bacterium]